MSTSATVSGASAHSAIQEVDVTWTSMIVRSCADLVSTVGRVSTASTRSRAAVRQATQVLSVSFVPLSMPTDAKTAWDLTVTTTPSTSLKTLRRRCLPWTVVHRRV